jgi:hypothetical protein
MRMTILDTSYCQEGVTVESEKDTDIAVRNFGRIAATGISLPPFPEKHTHIAVLLQNHTPIGTYCEAVAILHL